MSKVIYRGNWNIRKMLLTFFFSWLRTLFPSIKLVCQYDIFLWKNHISKSLNPHFNRLSFWVNIYRIYRIPESWTSKQWLTSNGQRHDKVCLRSSRSFLRCWYKIGKSGFLSLSLTSLCVNHADVNGSFINI